MEEVLFGLGMVGLPTQPVASVVEVVRLAVAADAVVLDTGEGERGAAGRERGVSALRGLRPGASRRRRQSEEDDCDRVTPQHCNDHPV